MARSAGSIGVILVLLAGNAAAQDSGDAPAGLTFARAQCGECHAVNPDQTASPAAGAPAFVAVARTPGMSELALNTFLQTPHRTMPNIVLSPQDRRDMAAYIMSLR